MHRDVARQCMAEGVHGRATALLHERRAVGAGEPFACGNDEAAAAVPLVAHRIEKALLVEGDLGNEDHLRAGLGDLPGKVARCG